MRYLINLQGKQHLEMEYQFVSTAAMEVPERLGATFSLLIYGFIFHHPERYPAFCSLLPGELQNRMPIELFYAGWAKLSFETVKGGTLIVHPYQPTFSPHFQQPLLDVNGLPMSLTRSWGDVDSDYCIEYSLQCTLENPFGSMYLKVQASGSVFLSVDTDDFIVAEEARTRPECWYDIHRSRQSNSI